MLKKKVFIIFILTVFICIVSVGIDLLGANYKFKYKKIKEPLELYIVDAKGKRIPLVLVNYTINNENENIYEKVYENYTDYEFKDDGIVINRCTDFYDIKCDEDVDFENIKVEEINYQDGRTFNMQNGTIDGNVYKKQAQNEPGEYFNIITIYASNGSYKGTYIYKELVIDDNEILNSKEFMNTSLTDKEKMDQIMKKIHFASFVNNYLIDNNSITIEYNIQLTKEVAEDISKMLLVLIDDLDFVKIIKNKDSNIKTEVVEKYEYQILPETEYLITKKDFENRIDSVEKIREYLEK